MVETTDHARLGEEQMNLIPTVFVPPEPEKAKRKRRRKKNRKQKTLTGLSPEKPKPKPKRIPEQPAVQFTFGVVVITKGDRERWKRASNNSGRKRGLKEISGHPMELIEWHTVLLEQSLEELKVVMGSTSTVPAETRKEILSWVAEPIEADIGNARLFSFQVCAFLSGMDPATMENYQQKAKEYESADQKDV